MTLVRYRIVTEGGGNNYFPERDDDGSWVMSCEAESLLARVTEDHKREAKASWEIRAERDELRAVLGLLRAHRIGPDWEQPIPAYLLDRECAALAKLEKP